MKDKISDTAWAGNWNYDGRAEKLKLSPFKGNEMDIKSSLLIAIRNNEGWNTTIIPAVEAISVNIASVKGDNEDRNWDLIVLMEKMIRDTLDISTIKDNEGIVALSVKFYQENMWKAMLRQAANKLLEGDING